MIAPVVSPKMAIRPASMTSMGATTIVTPADVALAATTSISSTLI